MMLTRLKLAVGVLVMISACSSDKSLMDDVTHAPAYDWRIERDECGVPTAIGATDAGAAYALAIAHAEDDFATLQSVVFSAKGMAGRIKGKEGAASDFLHALLKINEQLETYYDESLSSEVKSIVDAYADGLNRYAADHPDERIDGPWPITGRDIAGGFILSSPLFYGLDYEIGGLVAGTLNPCAGQLAQGDEGCGSNAFAVAPHASADGSTFLLINPHNPWDGPLAWYEARLHSDAGWRVAGGMLAGSPFPTGAIYNDAFASAPTVNRPDLVDHYQLTTNDKDQYYVDGQWRPFEKKVIWLKVKFGPIILPIRRTLTYTVHGPAFELESGWVAVSFPDSAADGTSIKML